MHNMENLARPSNDGAVDESGDAIAKIESRWRNAVKKASKRAADPEALMAFDAQRAKEIAPRAAAAELSAWSPVRAAQLRKVEPTLAEQQRDWLVPTVQGEFAFDDGNIAWRFVLPQPVARPVAVRLGEQPMQPVLDGDTDSVSTACELNESCELTVAVGSFLLNWITVPWPSLANEARNALVQVGLQPFVDSLGRAMNAHLQVSALISDGTPIGAAMPQRSELPITVGIEFRRDGVVYPDLACLQIPHDVYRQFLAHREATRPAFSIARLLAERPALADVVITLPVTVGEFSCELATAGSLSAGDVVFFAEHRGSAHDWWHSTAARIVSPSAQIDVRFDVGKHCVSVRAVQALHGQREPAHNHSLFRERDSIMQAKETPGGMPAADAALSSSHLAALPVTLTVEVATLQLPLHALEELTVGNTLPLQKPLNEQMLTLRANGQVIALGEMVMLEGEVGVRVRRLVSSIAPAADHAARSESTGSEEPAESVTA
jgi:type III secretion system YscQ/HrcQ family protein